MDNDPKQTSKVVAKCLKDYKVKVLEWPSQSSDLNPIDNLWAELKKCVRARRPANLTQLHQLSQEEWAKIHPIYCGKLVEGYPKHLTLVKQFKGNATKYTQLVCKLLTHWECDGRNKSWNKSFSLLLF
uniref:Tc1-like transposase DDE domain-containing protein n=1 Tax=Oncorhynchus tshawytscha TaxID=74940 RepID=A0AAZ3S559_ONCTS